MIASNMILCDFNPWPSSRVFFTFSFFILISKLVLKIIKMIIKETKYIDERIFWTGMIKLLENSLDVRDETLEIIKWIQVHCNEMDLQTKTAEEILKEYKNDTDR